MTLFSHYWGLRGFDITNSAAMQKGLQISGNHNLMKKVFFEKRIPYNDCCANAIQNEKEKRDVYGK
ncbi:hypothetical protein EfmAA242_05970 [Enterococcus faecium]|nr:hypothetical protein EfmAA242_05970 [Enterococcus faecium]